MSKSTKSVNLRDDQIENIERIEEGHPALRGEGFSAVLRWLIDMALDVVRREQEEEEEQK